MHDYRYGIASIAEPDFSSAPAAFRQELEDTFAAWANVRSRNSELMGYYRMDARIKDLGISIPPQMVNTNTVVGWADKAVRVMAVRSKFDGYAIGGGTLPELDALCRENGLSSLYDSACRGSLVYGVSAFTVMRGTGRQPAAKVRTFSASQCAMLWDKDNGSIRCGVTLQDVDRLGAPLRYIAHFPDAVVDISRADSESRWTYSVEANPQGVPLMVPMAYDPDDDRPLGHSRITPEVMGIIDKAMRDVLRMEVGAEFFTAPQRYILGAPRDLFLPDEGAAPGPDAAGALPGADTDIPDDDMPAEAPRRKPTPGELMNAYIGSFLAITRDENGDIPSVGQFPAGSADNFIKVFENDAQRFSGATNVPLGQLGVLSNTYTSSDALGAANDPLILEVQAMNRRNQRTMEQVGRLMLAISRNTTIDRLDENERAMVAHFEDPSMQTFGARVDGWTKLSAADKAIAGTRPWYEGVGLDHETIDRLLAAKEANAATIAYQQIFGQAKDAKVQEE